MRHYFSVPMFEVIPVDLAFVRVRDDQQYPDSLEITDILVHPHLVTALECQREIKFRTLAQDAVHTDLTPHHFGQTLADG